ncbi:MAG TPA: ATP-binding protein [Polyangia bacterium]
MEHGCPPSLTARPANSADGEDEDGGDAAPGGGRPPAARVDPAATPWLRLVERVRRLTGCAAARVCLTADQVQARRGFGARFAPVRCLARAACAWIPAASGRRSGVVRGERGGYATGGLARTLAAAPARRGACDLCRQGRFESVAVVPVRLGRRTLGLVHVADRAAGRLGREQLGRLEGFADALGEMIGAALPAPAPRVAAGLDGVLVVDVRRGRVVHVNDTACELLRYSRAELLAMPLARAPWAPALGDLKAQLRRVEDEEPRSEPVALRRKDGVVITADALAVSLRAAGRPYLGVFVREVGAPPDPLDVVTLVSSAQERERARVASALHDGVMQTLALARLRLDTVRLAARADAPLRRDLEELDEIFARSVREVRVRVLALAPPPTQTTLAAGVAAAVRWFRHAGARAIVLRDDGRTKLLEPAACEALVRAAHELLANAVRHAHAHRTTITLSRSGRTVRVHVEDDGIGFDPGALRHGRTPRGGASGYGLASVCADLAAVGATLVVDSAPGRGTRATVTVRPAGGRRDGGARR